MKQQLLFIHGGMTFNSEKAYLKFLKTRPVTLENAPRWGTEYLNEMLGRQCQIIRPRMPLQDNASYCDWKIAFERYIPLLKPNAMLLGVSLGGVFLAKYLSEHRFPKKLRAVYLVAPPFDDTHSIPEDELYGGFVLKKDLSLLEKNAPNLSLHFSVDDKVVPPYHAMQYAKHLTHAKFFIYSGKHGHFMVTRFPELARLIKADLRQRRAV